MALETNKGKQSEQPDKKVEKAKPRELGQSNVPAIGGAVGDIVPKDGQDRFLRFASTKPRLLAILAKKELSGQDEKEITAAYEACAEETMTAIVVDEVPKLAPVLGISEEKTAEYLEVYKPEDLKKMALVAQREELETEDVLSVDLALLEDGSYSGREKETLTVSMAHDALSRHLEEELSNAGMREAVREEDDNLDNLWERLVKEHDGDELAATEAYAQAAEDMLLGKKAEAKEKKVALSTEIVVEMFKLFNYDQKDIQAFVEFAVNTQEIIACENEETSVKLFFDEALRNFVKENALGVVLNERSNLYRRLRPVQIQALVDLELIPKEAMREVDPGEFGKTGDVLTTDSDWVYVDAMRHSDD